MNEKEIEKIARQAVTGLLFDPQLEPIIFQEEEAKIKRVVEALKKAVIETKRELMKNINKIDPFSIKCDWETPEDVAYEVHKYIVKVIQDSIKET